MQTIFLQNLMFLLLRFKSWIEILIESCDVLVW